MWFDSGRQANVGAFLEKTRKAADVTQSDLAKRLKKPQSFVSSCESGQRRVDLVEFAAIADALGEDPIELSREVFRALAKTSSPAKRRSQRKTER